LVAPPSSGCVEEQAITNNIIIKNKGVEIFILKLFHSKNQEFIGNVTIKMLIFQISAD
jgi:hypothetical protein